MSDVEQRLRDALNARAELVQPEDLNLNPVFEPSEPEDGPWWRHPGAYLFMAAVAVIVIGLPLLALAATGPEGDKEPVAPATNPTNTGTMTDPAPIQVDQDTADVDGDGTDDQIRVLGPQSPGAEVPDFKVTVELSTTGRTISYLTGEAADVKLGATANLNGRPGEEIVLALESEIVDLHRAEPMVLSLLDGALISILFDDVSTDAPGREDTRTYWWVHDGQLWWWRSQEVVADGDESPYAVDVLRFPREDVLRGVDYGTWCVTSFAATRLLDCEDPASPSGSAGTEGPDGTDDPDAGAIDPWWEQGVEGLPSAWVAESAIGALSADIDADGAVDSVSLTAGRLAVDLGDQQLTATVDGPNPTLEGVVVLDGRTAPVIVGHTTEGAAGTTYVSWFAYAVIGGDLVELGTAPLGPAFASQYSNLTPGEGGHPTARTWRPDEGSLLGMDYLDRAQVEGPEGATVWVYLVRVRSWYVDGALLRATTLGQGCLAPALGNQFYACPEGF